MNTPRINLVGNPHWDFQSALRRVNNNEQLLREISAIFLERMAVMLSNIKLALCEGNTEMLVMSSHTLKGSAGNMAANPTMEIADRFEELAEKNELASIGPVWEELQQETAHLQQTIARWLDDGTSEDASTREW
jgi:HPt (histidine-containing phosphotransfer) domain-containing protein